MHRFRKSIVFVIIISIVAPFLLLGVLLLLATYSNAPLSYRSVDYDLTIEKNGNLRVRQTIDMTLKKRENKDGKTNPWRQFYQTYNMSPSALTNISQISVKNLTTNTEYTQVEPKNPSRVNDYEWNTQYAQHWYIADVTHGSMYPEAYDTASDGLQPGPVDLSFFDATTDSSSRATKQVEVGWNIPVTQDADSIKFQVEMTFEGAATAYNDVTALKWELISPTNDVPIKKVSGIVHFPSGATLDNSRAWLHFPGLGESDSTDDTLTFNVSDMRPRQHLDLIFMTDVANTSGVARKQHDELKQWLLDSENKQEEALLERNHRNAIIQIVIWAAIIIAGIALAIIGVLLLMRNKKETQYHGEIEYWREPPAMSPGSAAELYDALTSGSTSSLLDRQMSATMLSLVTKGAIAVYPGPSSTYVGIDMSNPNSAALAQMLASQRTNQHSLGKTSTIVILPVALQPDISRLNLCESERIALKILIEAYERLNTPVFDMDQMGKAFKKWDEGQAVILSFTTACTSELNATHALIKGGFRGRLVGILETLLGIASMAWFMLWVGNLALALCVSVPIMAIGLFLTLSVRYQVINPEADQYAGEVLGLARYMDDFSNFSDRGVPDLVLWNRYLVYAAAFGMSERALKQLMTAYPQLQNSEWADSHIAHRNSIIYWSTRPHHFSGGFDGLLVAGSMSGIIDLGSQLGSGFSAISATIQAAASIGSVSGGSFKGGPFAGSGGGAGGGSFGGR